MIDNTSSKQNLHTYTINLLRELILGEMNGVVYAGVVGSSLCRMDAVDVDVSAVVDYELTPTFMHVGDNISLLAFDSSWLTYEKHRESPVGLIPSILFKSIELSLPVVGDKNSLGIPEIRVCDADYVNLKIKKSRFIHSDRKNYLVALVFERLLRVSPDMREYHFDNISLAEELGLPDITDELRRITNSRIAF